MKQLGAFDFDIHLDRINKAGDPLVQLNDNIDWEIFRSTLEEARKKPKGVMSFCCLKSLYCNRCTIFLMKRWNSKFLIGILFPGFLVFMPPVSFQMQRPSGVSEKI